MAFRASGSVSEAFEIQTALDSRMLVFRKDQARLTPTIRTTNLHLGHHTLREGRVQVRVQTSVWLEYG